MLDSNMKKPLTSKAKEYLASRRVLDAPFLKEPLYSIVSKDGKEEYKKTKETSIQGATSGRD